VTPGVSVLIMPLRCSPFVVSIMKFVYSGRSPHWGRGWRPKIFLFRECHAEVGA
jgi:hypothetical protein